MCARSQEPNQAEAPTVWIFFLGYHSYEAYSTALWLLHGGPKINPKIKLKGLRYTIDDFSVMLPLADCQCNTPNFEARMLHTVVMKYQALPTMQATKKSFYNYQKLCRQVKKDSFTQKLYKIHFDYEQVHFDFKACTAVSKGSQKLIC